MMSKVFTRVVQFQIPSKLRIHQFLEIITLDIKKYEILKSWLRFLQIQKCMASKSSDSNQDLEKL